MYVIARNICECSYLIILGSIALSNSWLYPGANPSLISDCIDYNISSESIIRQNFWQGTNTRRQRWVFSTHPKYILTYSLHDWCFAATNATH